MKRIVFDIDFDKELEHLKESREELRVTFSELFTAHRKDRKLYFACLSALIVSLLLFAGSLPVVFTKEVSAFPVAWMITALFGVVGFGGGLIDLGTRFYSKKNIEEAEDAAREFLVRVFSYDFSELILNMEDVRKVHSKYWYVKEVCEFLTRLEGLETLYTASQMNAFQCTPDSTDVNSWTNVQICCSGDNGLVSTLEARCKYQKSITTEDAYFTYIDHVPTLVGTYRE